MNAHRTLNLAIHCGTYRVQRHQVADAATPAATATHRPIPHIELSRLVATGLARRHLEIGQEAHAITADGARYFAMLQVLDPRATDWSTVIGLRNAHDKSFAAGLVCGSGVFVCDNLCFFGDVKVARKHTPHILRDLPHLVSDALDQILLLQSHQAIRIEAYKATRITHGRVNDLLIAAFDAGVISSAKIGQVLHQWRHPSYPEFSEGKTVWRLMNAFTEVLKPRERGHDLWTLPAKTEALHALLDRTCGVEPLATLR